MNIINSSLRIKKQFNYKCSCGNNVAHDEWVECALCQEEFCPECLDGSEYCNYCYGKLNKDD